MTKKTSLSLMKTKKRLAFSALCTIVAGLLAMPALAEKTAESPTIKELSCNAMNFLGVAKMDFDSQHNEIVANINLGQFVYRYRVGEVTASNERTPGFASSGSGVTMTRVGGSEHERMPYYKLLFNQDLKVGETQEVSGQLVQVSKFETVGPAGSTVKRDSIIPLSFVTCKIQLAE